MKWSKDYFRAFARRLKEAVTVVSAVRVTVQVLFPLQAPLQPEKVEPAAGAAVSVTVVPLGGKGVGECVSLPSVARLSGD